MELIRVWKEMDLGDIDSHLIIADDLHGFCPSCKHTGIKYGQMDKCPSCNTVFKYAAARKSSGSFSSLQVIAKIHKNNPALTIIDYDDYKHHSDKKKAASLFNIPSENQD